VNNYDLLVPEFILLAGVFAVIFFELFFPTVRKDLIAYFAALWGVAALVAACFYPSQDPDTFQDIIQVDDYTSVFRIVGAGILIATCVASADYVRHRVTNVGEYYGLLLLSLIGFNIMAAARELLTAYIALELLSFSLYTLVSYLKRDSSSNEAGLKYLLLGAFSSALFLYGLSMIYGVAGTTTYDGISEALANRNGDTDFAVVIGMVLIMVGIGFKISAVPFHQWAPDAYQGAPVPITAYLSTASKAAGFALFLRLFSGAFMPAAADWTWLIAAMSAITMVLGNFVAIQQSNLRRLFAYSSIAQVGYMLAAIAALNGDSLADSQGAASTLLLHLIGYAVTNLAAFSVLIAFYNKTGKDDINDLRGLAETQPFLALMMTASLFSLAGMPLFAGFATKFFLFQAVVDSGYLWLAVLAIVNSMISLYYYLVVIKQMYLGKPWFEGRLQVPLMMKATIFALTAGVMFLGIWPTPLWKAVDNASEFLFNPSVEEVVSRAPAILF
jgi:NADH-quinone oxidoreductase subunit N